MALNFDTLMGRASFYDNYYEGLAPYRNQSWYQNGADNARGNVRKDLIKNNSRSGYLPQFNSSYARYVSQFNQGKRQQAELASLKAQQAAQVARSEAEARSLQVQQNKRLAKLAQQQKTKAGNLAKAQAANVKRMAATQAKKVGGIRSRGQSVSSSLSILAEQQPMAPSAVRTDPRARRKGAASTAAQVARGSSRNRGPNLSI